MLTLETSEKPSKYAGNALPKNTKLMIISREAIEELESKIKTSEIPLEEKITVSSISIIIERLLGSSDIPNLIGLTTQGKLFMCAAALTFEKCTKKTKSFVPVVSLDEVHSIS